MNLNKFPEFDDHELVAFFNDRRSGLRSVVAVHNTNLGPATGGTRYYSYARDADALRDALRLSRAMTYKCALAGVPYGGGKGVILADTRMPKNAALLRRYAEGINKLNGRFSTGEDVGLTQNDIEIMSRVSPHINGARGAGELGPWAALGVFSAMQAALQEVFGSDEIRGRIFAIKGLGKVGWNLCRLLYERGGEVIGADINPRVLKSAQAAFPRMRIVSPAAIKRVKADVYSPCAMGGEFDMAAVKSLRAPVICGGANNQLAQPSIAVQLHRCGIIYVPDYVANAGGLINAVAERESGGYKPKSVDRKVRRIADVVRKILSTANRRSMPPGEVADRLARDIINRRREQRSLFV
ncbi:MAG: Glu/Leu/Phe/Val dehydrogenase dimerization domain-containing protein [Patescibacteria group bacterium]